MPCQDSRRGYFPLCDRVGYTSSNPNAILLCGCVRPRITSGAPVPTIPNRQRRWPVSPTNVGTIDHEGEGCGWGLTFFLRSCFGGNNPSRNFARTVALAGLRSGHWLLAAF